VFITVSAEIWRQDAIPEFNPLVSVLLRTGAGLYLAAMVAGAIWLLVKIFRLMGPHSASGLWLAHRNGQDDLPP
jgi:hypothetical protein